MKMLKKAAVAAAALLAAVASMHAYPQVRDTEVAPWASGNAPYASDWFELTNVGAAAVSIAGWKMDDSSAAFATAAALTGITSIAAGESVLFIESAAAIAGFLSAWFGAAAPALQIGNYTGAGVGLSTSGMASRSSTAPVCCAPASPSGRPTALRRTSRSTTRHGSTASRCRSSASRA